MFKLDAYAPAFQAVVPVAARAVAPRHAAVAAPVRASLAPKTPAAPRLAVNRPAPKAWPASPAAAPAPVRPKVAAGDKDDWESF